MIKRLGVCILALLYFITATGFAVNLHYCCNTLASVNIDGPAKSCGALMGKMKCCKDKHIEVKVKDVHQSQTSSPVIAKAFPVGTPALPCANYLPSKPRVVICNICKNRPDPPPDKTPKFLSGRQLLI